MSEVKRFIINFKEGTADEVVDKAIEDIKLNGGTLYSDYRPLMPAFAADVPEAYLNSFKSSLDDQLTSVEADGTVTTQI